MRKRKRKVKNPFVRYPTEEQVEKLTGIRMHIK